MTATAPASPAASTSSSGRIVCRQVAVEGVRFALHRADPSRKRRTTPALLLHGVPETARMWHPLMTELARDRIALAPDLKGLGESEVRGPYDIPTLVRELAALALHEVDGRVDVVGHDWGGSLALALAGARPDLVRRLVVINAPYRSIDYTRAWHMPFFALPGLPELVFAIGGRALVGRMLDYGWRAATPLDADLRDHYSTAYADAARVGAMLSYYRAVARPRIAAMVRSLLRRDDKPSADRSRGRVNPEAALVIWGAEDPVLPLPVGEAVVRDLGPETRFITLPRVGHFTVDEAPEQVTASVAEFLREGGPEPARPRE